MWSQSRVLAWLGAAALGAAIACSDDGAVEPAVDDNSAVLTLVAGTSGTDTIGTRLLQGLVVEVKSRSGAPRRGVAVRFDALKSADTARRFEPTANVARGLSTDFNAFASDTTDERGRTIVVVRLGNVAGPAGIVVSVPEFGLADTATYTVTPGRVHSVEVGPADTLIGIGRQVTLRARVLDVYRNVRTDAVTYTLLSGSCSVPAPGTVVGTSVGSCRVTAGAQQALDTATVVVAPAWDLIGVSANDVVRMNLGTGVRTVVGPTQGGETYPSATRQGFVAYRGGNHMVVVKPDGRRVDPLVRALLPSWSGWGRLTRNNVAVYFAGDGAIYRATVDGEGLDVVFTGTTPDTSPDGSLCAFQNDGIIRVGNVTTKAVTSLGVPGTMPRWSPTGDRIAYLSGGRVWVMRADGSNRAAVSRPDTYYGDNSGLDWSEDGEWLVASSGPLDLVRANGTDVVSIPNLGFTQVSVVR